MNNFFEIYKPFVLSIMVAILAVPFIWILQPFWLTIILGLVFAMSLVPILNWLEKKMHTRSTWTLVLLLIGLTLIIIIPFGLVLLKGTEALWLQLKKLNTPGSIEMLKGYQTDLMTRIDVLKDYGIDTETVQNTLWNTAQKAGAIFTGKLGDLLAQIPEAVMLFFVLILSIISFLTMRRETTAAIKKINWISESGKKQLVDKFKGSCRSVVVSTIVTGALQASLTTIGAWIFTDYNGLLVFFITFILSFIPIIGAGPVSLVMALIAFANSQVGDGIGLLVFCGFISVADNIIRPLLLAGSTKIPSIWALLCTIGALIIFGLPGLFIGPLIGALAFDLIPVLVEEFQK